MRTVVVASGKGGTGKTTLSALFALVASRTGSVVVADADVEASNLPLALDVSSASCDAFTGGLSAVIDASACTACGACLKVCRFGAIQPPVAPEVSAAGGAYSIDRWACEGCTACARVCPALAIEMVPSTAGEACSGTCRTGPIAFGQLGPGEDLSGRLVTEVRTRASKAADDTQADLLIVDGPPGIGCPVIAAVTNTDLLVAVTEPSRSGEHDLGRLFELASRFSLPVVVVLNKADLSPAGAQMIRESCERMGVELIAEIPFDEQLSGLLGRLASAGEAGPYSAGMKAAEKAWSEIAYHLADGA